MDVSRRMFLKATAAGTVMLMLPARTAQALGHPAGQSLVLAAIPGGSLDPVNIPRYQTPLLIPPAMPRVGWVWSNGKLADYYEIAVRQFQQQILPPSLPKTTVWGYGPNLRSRPAIFNAPSLTIEASHGTPVRVKWINELVDAKGNYLPHLLPVDQTLHWANPPGGATGRDTRPTFNATPGRYTGPVPMVPHVHGMEGVGDESDGYAEAWYLPAAKNSPTGYAKVGTWYDFFKRKAQRVQRMAWSPGSAIFQYPNSQRASTAWYHDHTLGMTRTNVYAGPAGFFLIRGGAEDRVKDSRTGRFAVLPGPAPARGDPSGKRYYEIPIAIQDRAFNTDGSLFYPDTRLFFGELIPIPPSDPVEFIPFTDIAPIWNPEFFGNCIMVNGNTWPFLNVEQRRYRFRFLNGCNSRFLILDFSAIPGVKVWMIGNEGGFLAAPVNVTTLPAPNTNKILLGPAERADVIVDFTGVTVGNYVLGNVGSDSPFGGLPIDPLELADANSTGQIMQFRVGPIVGTDKSTPPEFLRLPAVASLTGGTVRRLALLEMMSMDFVETPAEALLGTLDAAGNAFHKMWMDPITENPAVGATEVWEFYNFTADAHPMHIHEVFFQVVNREGLVLDPTGVPVQPVQLAGTPRPPEVWENGWKETVIAYPGEVTLRAKFKVAGQFVWHCHIVEHEDNEMMRPYRIGPAQPFQPGSMEAADGAAIPEEDVPLDAEIIYEEDMQNSYLPWVGGGSGPIE